MADGDEDGGDEGLSQRERRALRHRKAKRTRTPGETSASFRKWRGPLVIALIVLVGAGAIYYLNEGQACPGHWHGTFAAFVPDSNGQPHRIDWHAPQDPQRPGQVYYNLGNDPNMGAAVHMHQSGAEQGSEALGPAQFHFEGNRCVPLQSAFSTIDLDISPGHMAVHSGTPLATVNGVGPWNDNGDEKLHFFLQYEASNGTYVWEEQDLGGYLRYQPRDGESVMLAYGHYTDEQYRQMEAQVPPPISRIAHMAHTTSASATSGATGSGTDLSTTSGTASNSTSAGP